MAMASATAVLPSIDEFRSLLLEEEQYPGSVNAMGERPAVLDCCELSGCATCASCSSCTTA